ncbi:unnamed protein product, partial [Rotaria magnacalcarata]
WSIRIFVHNGLSVMLAWQITLVAYSSLYACNRVLLSSSSTVSNEINESTLNLISICLIGSMCIIAIFYILIMSCCFSNTMCHVVAGWIFLILLTIIHWYYHNHQLDSLLLKSFYVSAGLFSFIICLHLILALFRYSGATCRSLTNSNRYNYRHGILQGKD